MSVTNALFSEIRRMIPSDDSKEKHIATWGKNKRDKPAPNIVYRDGDNCGSGIVYPEAYERYFTFLSLLGWHSDEGVNCVVMERIHPNTSVAAFDLDVEFRGSWKTGDSHELPAYGGTFMPEIYTLIRPLRTLICLLYEDPGECITCIRRPTQKEGTKKKVGIHVYFPGLSMGHRERSFVNHILFNLLSNGVMQKVVSSQMSITNHQASRGGCAFDQVFDVHLDSLRCLASTKGFATRKAYTVVDWSRYSDGKWVEMNKGGEVGLMFSDNPEKDQRITDLRKSLLRRICLFVDRGEPTEMRSPSPTQINELIQQLRPDEQSRDPIDQVKVGEDGKIFVPERKRAGDNAFAKDMVLMDPTKFTDKDIEMGIPEKYELADSMLHQIIGERYVELKSEQGQQKMRLYRPKKGFKTVVATCAKGGVCAYPRPQDASSPRSRMAGLFRRRRYHYHESNKTTWTLTPGFVSFYCTQCSQGVGPMVFPYTSSFLSNALFNSPLPKPTVTKHYSNRNQVISDAVTNRTKSLVEQHERETCASEKRESVHDLISKASYNFF